MNLFKLTASLGLDTSEYERKSGEAVDSGHHLAGKLGSALASTAKVVAAGVAAAATGITALTTMAVNDFADYEQAMGGTQLLFGDAAGYIAQKSKEAYKTVQMSQNDYLVQANGFATGLKTALGGNEQAAAELADKIITAEADIVAATGNSQENIQNAFNGIMKSNFTMLDNLQLGITPTKEGFQEVIDKVNEWNTANGNATDYQIDNLADAQSALIDYIKIQGLAGYAAAEGAQTIQGSMSSAKAAFHNLVVGMADDQADVDGLMDNLVSAVGTTAELMLPRIEQTLAGVVLLIDKLAPMIVDKLPGLIQVLLPKIISTAGHLIESLVKALPGLIQVVVDLMPTLLLQVMGALVKAIPLMLTAAQTVLDGLAAMLTDEETMHSLIDSAIAIILQIATFLIQNIPLLVDAAINIVMALADYLLDPENLKMLADAAVDLILSLLNSLIFGAIHLFDAGVELAKKIKDGIFDTDWEAVAGEAIDNLWDGLVTAWENVKSWFSNAWDNLFGGRSVDVSANVSTNRYDGSHASGLEYVPFDGYIAQLHRGERVLTREEARGYGSKGATRIDSVQININGGDYGSKEELAEAVAYALQDLSNERRAAYA